MESTSAPIVAEATYVYDAPPEQVWPMVADSNLMSELLGPGRYQVVEEVQPDGTVLRHATGDKFGPFVKAWTEDLGEWVYARQAISRRKVTVGMFETIDFLADLIDTPNGTELKIHVAAAPRGVIGWFGRVSGVAKKAVSVLPETLDGMVRSHLEANRKNEDPITTLNFSPPELSPTAIERLRRIREILSAEESSPGLAERLVGHVRAAPEAFLQRMRPLALAQDWQVEAAGLVDLCLAGTANGLLSLRWEVLCPRCRNGREASDNLQALPENLHCTSCNIDYERDFSHNVELLFEPESWLRAMPEGAACLMGPASVPHIKVQRDVDGGAERTIDPPLSAGTYRLRTAQAGPELEFEVEIGAAFPDMVIGDDGPAVKPAAEAGRIRLINRSGRRRTFVIEELGWRRDALTGDKAVASAAFRRYRPEQLLAPGDDVRIANIVLMFTDLKGSTSLYEALGDTPAYALVRDHFRFLGDIVERHRGVLIKTMGDSVMAAFDDPLDAINGALAARSGAADFNQGREDGGIVLKLGLHQGPCIAVTNGGLLDYFGATVNMTARLEGASVGNDIVLSRAMIESAGVEARCKAAESLQIATETINLRGFEAPVDIWRLTANEHAT